MASSRYALSYAPALDHVLHEANDIAQATGRRVGSYHVLLAFFTTRNQAERLLRDRQIDEDRLLALVEADVKEPPDALIEILERSAQVAAGCGAREVDTLHVLVAMTRARDSVAYALLEATGEKLSLLRTRALTILTGAVPRWLETGKRARPGVAEARVTARPHRSKIGHRVGLEADRPPHLTWVPPIVMGGQKPGAKRPPAAPPKGAHPALDPVKKRPEAESKPPEAPVAKAPEPVAKTPGPVVKPPVKPAKPPEPKPAVALVDPAARQPAARQPAAIQPAAPAGDPAEAWLLAPEEYPWLTSLGRNLSVEAARGALDRLVGREKEVEALLDILGKRRANNPCLVGEPGVGKTAVVEGLARRLVSARGAMGDKIIVSLDVGALLVGTHLRGSFSEKLQGLRDEVKQSEGRVVVFFDELHTLVGAGSTGDGPQDAANELKGALARGDFPCIGATTCDEYAEHVEKDAALARRFVPVLVKEPGPDDAAHMLRQIVPAYADHHGVAYGDDAIVASVELSTRYLTEGHLPDKAIALLDLAGSRAARAAQEQVRREDIARLVAQRADLPLERVLASDSERLLHLESHLRREIVGHEAALTRIAEVIRRNAAGFRSHRPQGVFLFLGPTGVGKTETAKALAKLLHGSADDLIRLDLSEFSEGHTVARLVGSPPGYVGHDAGGQLTEAVRRKPGRVVLFDELEKAHPDVLQVLLQIMDEGRLTDARGRTVSFAETIIIMTSNLGSDLAKNRPRIGFGGEAEQQEALHNQILERAREGLAPELWGRIEDRLVFGPLSRAEARRICLLLAQASSRRLTRSRGISYDLDERALEFVLEQGGYDARLGARPMRHVLSRLVEAPIAARILEGRLHADEHVEVSTRAGGGLIFLVGDDSLSQRPRA
ncbi:MAG: ATP-dependent Clp protease ATP-binding subunit [Myxococcales bacterium]|nr:ATP-dependent Clp protease ATP-binding subunit [Myxococcales bacterium]